MLAQIFNQSNKILICDDLQTVRRLLRKQLAELGIVDILEARNGKEALELVRQGGVRLVLSDWHMPEMSGMDLLRAVRSDTARSSMPMILITSMNDKESVVEAAKEGVNDFIVKPFSRDILASKLRKALEASAEDASQPAS